jgi:hypothetical protein
MESVSFLTDGAGSTSSATVHSGASTLSPFRSLDVDHRINGTPGAISTGSFRSRLGGPSRGRVSLGSVSRPVDPLDPPAEPLQPAPPDRTIFPPGSRPAVLAQARPAVKKSVALRDAPARRASRAFGARIEDMEPQPEDAKGHETISLCNPFFYGSIEPYSPFCGRGLPAAGAAGSIAL